MSYINVVISLKEFYPFIKDILNKYNASIYIETKVSETIKINVLITEENYYHVIENNRDKYLKFFITTLNLDINDKEFNFYDEEKYNYTIEGIGGREKKNEVERINLRIISKAPDKSIKLVFNAIKLKLKKNELFAIGVEGNSSLHKNYFYLKSYVGKKVMKTDFFNDNSPKIIPLIKK